MSIAKCKFGNPYWWDTYGQTATEELYLEKKKLYPEHYEANDFASQYGKRVFDCSGLIKGYLWSSTFDEEPKYNSLEDFNAGELFKLCKIKGEIESLPDIPGILLFFTGHVGVYIGGRKSY